MLVACLVLICRPSFRPDSFRVNSSCNAAPAAHVPVRWNDPLLNTSIAAAPDANMAPPTPVADWEKRFFEIADEPEWLRSEQELAELAGTLTDSQLRDALDKLAVEQSDAGTILGGLLVRRWAEQSPADAARWISGLSDNDFGHRVFTEVITPWAQKDLSAAVAWVQQLPPGGNRTAAVFSLASEAAAQHEAVTAINLTTSLPPGAGRDDLLNYAAQQWAATDRDGAVRWITQIQDPRLRETMLGKIALQWGVQDPSAAASLIATSMAVGPVRDEAVVDVIRFWAASAPETAAAWVEQFPAGNLRVTAVNNLADVWNQADPAAAGAWAATVVP